MFACSGACPKLQVYIRGIHPPDHCARSKTDRAHCIVAAPAERLFESSFPAPQAASVFPEAPALHGRAFLGPGQGLCLR